MHRRVSQQPSLTSTCVFYSYFVAGIGGATY